MRGLNSRSSGRAACPGVRTLLDKTRSACLLRDKAGLLRSRQTSLVWAAALSLFSVSGSGSLGFRHSGMEQVQGTVPGCSAGLLALRENTQDSSSISDRPSHPSRGTRC